MTDRTAALLDTLEHQAQWGLDEITRLRRRLETLEAENIQLRDTLKQRETALAQAAVPRSAAERNYPLPPRRPVVEEQVLEEHAQAPSLESVSSVVKAQPDTVETIDSDDSVSASTGDELPSPQALLDEWYRRYTNTFFKGHTRPLKVGIHEELMQHETRPDKLVRRALACYVHLPRYLKAVRAGAERIDLEGLSAGLVTDGEARHARKQLESLQAQQRERDAARKRDPETRKNARLDNKLSELLAKHSRS
ncbi:ProQ/FINO family protein [Halomonas sp. PR-M31]|uniref:ProQ/FINO family protein n=1 Tax=Halomonas sp. PR-M31 TaxID=1471202 RepID=UPI000A58AEE4|nr:ProQ/FINO family protein [Halomonas sp. PR-M31]